VPQAGGAIQVGSAHGAKSTAVRAARGRQRNGQENGIPERRFEVCDVPVEAITVGIIVHPEGLEELHHQWFLPFREAAMAGVGNQRGDRAPHHDAPGSRLQDQVGRQPRADP
jgi:hypothetical protein